MLQDMSEKKIPLNLIFQIFFLSILIRGSSLFVNPYLLGPDTIYHYHNIQQLIDIGHLSTQFYHYYFFPSYYLSQGFFGLISDFSPGIFNLYNLIVGSLSILLGYSLGKAIFKDSKAGLISALLISISPLSIFCVVYNTGKIGGLFLFLLCLFIQIKIIKSNDKRYIFIFWLAVLPLFLWHPELSFAIIPILFSYALINYNNCYGIIKNYSLLISSGFLLYVIIYLVYLFFVHTTLGDIIVEMIFSEKMSIGLMQSIETSNSSSFDYLLILQLISSYIGITIFMFFVAFICLKWLEKPNKVEIFLILTLIFLQMNPLIGVFTGKFSLGGERALITTSALISIIASGSIIYIFKNKTWNSLVIVSVFLFWLTFFSTTCYLIGDGNEIFNDKIPMGTIFTTESNMQSHFFLKLIPEEKSIAGDYESLRYITDPLRGYYLIKNQKKYLLDVDSANFLYVNIPNLKKLHLDSISESLSAFHYLKEISKLYGNGVINIYSET
jgi:hypothetical protein